MSVFMEPGHLEEDELMYELSLREMPPVNTRHRTATLRERLLRESRGDSPVPNKVSYRNVLDEVKLCARKISEVEGILLTVAETGGLDPLVELSSRLLHFKTRLNRISCQDSRVIKYIENLNSKVDKYITLVADTRGGKVILSERLKENSVLVVDSMNNFLSTPSNHDQGLDEARALTPTQDTSRGAIRKSREALNRYLPLPTDGLQQYQSSPKSNAGEELSNLLLSVDLNDSQSESLFHERGASNTHPQRLSEPFN